MEEKEKISELAEGQEKLPTKMSKSRMAMSRVKRRLLKHLVLVRIGILLGIVVLIGLVVLITGKVLKNSSLTFYTEIAKDFVFTPENKIKSLDGHTNILILGKGGLGHEAPDLTDTIMLASINHSTPSFNLISLPRDIWITDLRTKLNSVYYWGNKKQQGGGIIMAKSEIEEISGQPIDYVVVLDFSGFRKIIDVLGGIDVEIDTSFTDDSFPIAGRENDTCNGDKEFKCRYESVHFEKGVQKMDGETALKFVRSRYAKGDEGTDFARAARQQKVIEGMKKKVFSKEILLSPKKLLSLRDAVNSSLETDLTPEAEAIIGRRMLQTKFNPKTHVLPEALLENPPKLPKYDNLYVFIPKGSSTAAGVKEDWTKVHEWVKCVVEEKECS